MSADVRVMGAQLLALHGGKTVLVGDVYPVEVAPSGQWWRNTHALSLHCWGWNGTVVGVALFDEDGTEVARTSVQHAFVESGDDALFKAGDLVFPVFVPGREVGHLRGDGVVARHIPWVPIGRPDATREVDAYDGRWPDWEDQWNRR